MTKKDVKTVAASSLKMLGGALPVFNVKSQISRADGTAAEINVKVSGMRKSAWAKMRDEHITAAKEKSVGASGEFTFEKMVAASAAGAAELIVKAGNGWDLEEEFNIDNLMELEDVLPGALQTILSDIDAGLFQGRAGN